MNTASGACERVFDSFNLVSACKRLLCFCVRRGVRVLRHRVLGDLHVPGALLGDAEQELAGLQRLHGEQHQGQRGCGLQLRHLPEAGHAADAQHIQPAVHRGHPGHERYRQRLTLRKEKRWMDEI